MKIALWIIAIIIIAVVVIILVSPKPPADVEQAGVQDITPTENDAQADDVDDTTQLADGEEERDGPMIEARATTVPLTFSFVGYGPGKSHEGTFENFDVLNVDFDANGVPTVGTVVFKTASIKTDSSVLDGHLCDRENFLDCATYPNITFNLTNVELTGGTNYTVTGNLTIKDVTKQISFSVEAESATDFSSEFRVDMTEFGFGAPGVVNDEVLVRFSGSLI